MGIQSMFHIKKFKADRKSVSLSLDPPPEKFHSSKPLVVFNPAGERIEIIARMHVGYRLLLILVN